MIYRGQPFLGWTESVEEEALKAFHSLQKKKAINSKGHFLIWLQPSVAEVRTFLTK